MTTEKIQIYLDRIHFSGVMARDLKTLQELHRAHIMHIPFENLDIHNKVRIELDKDRLFEKIVRQHRGGFCYELNGIYCELLMALGYEMRRLAARVYNKEGVRGPEFDHLALLVSLDGTDYLTDIGFGEFTFAPMKFSLGEQHLDERGTFCIEEMSKGEYRVIKLKADQRVPQYTFKNQDYSLEDYEPMCQYHQTSPDSHFTHKRFITRPTPNGRITLFEDKITFKENDEVVVERPVKGKKHFDLLLKQYFDMEL